MTFFLPAMRTKLSQSAFLTAMICTVVIFSTACAFPLTETSTTDNELEISSSSQAFVQDISTSIIKNDMFTYETPWPQVRLGPYIQSVSQDSVIIAWQTEGESVGEVRYGISEELAVQVKEASAQRQHAIYISNLEPDTQYFYQVFSDANSFSDILSFKTLIASDQSDFKFVVYGDTQKNQMIHAAIIDLALDSKPAFVIHMGDLVDEGDLPQEWIDFFTIESELLRTTSLFPTYGNHDGDGFFYDSLFFTPGDERWYTFTNGNARFISLEVAKDRWPDIEPTSEQYKWLESELSKNDHPWLIVFFHMPPYTSEYGSDEDRYERTIEETLFIRDNLTPLFEKFGVDLVLNGHHHNYQRSQANGITYIVSGGGGARLSHKLLPDEFLETYQVIPHLLEITIDDDRIVVDAISAYGERFDTFTLSQQE